MSEFDHLSSGLSIGKAKQYGRNCIEAYHNYQVVVRHEMLKIANGASKEVNNCLANQLHELWRSYNADKTPEETAMLLWGGE